MLTTVQSLSIVSILAVTSLDASVIVSRPPSTPIDNGNGVISGESNRFGNFRGVYPADYFELEEATTLKDLIFYGTNQPDGSVGFLYSGFSVHIFEDSAGEPDGFPYDPRGRFGSTALVSLLNVSRENGLRYLTDDDGVTDIGIDLEKALGVPLVLTAGSYWISVAPRMPDTPVGDPSGRWNWQMSRDGSDVEPAWIDSDIGRWISVSEHLGRTAPGRAFAWQLEGEAAADPVPVTLTVVQRGDGFDFRLEGANNSTPWVLQHSSDLENFEDFLFFDEFVIGGGTPRVTVPFTYLPEGVGQQSGYFRARPLRADDPVGRGYLDGQARWRAAGIRSYEYGLRQNFGMISWRGTVTVTDGEVSGFETLDLQPPFIGVPEIPTVGALFGRIADAVERGAETVEATWHPQLGYPESGFIDLDSMLFDEEQGWTILSFSAAP